MLLTMRGSCFAVPSFTAGISQGNIQNSSIDEASGIVSSRANPNVLWTHNDSGDSARLFAMTTAGANLGVYTILGASATDWEDIALGPGPVDGQQYLYAADIGDNALARSTVSIYRSPEPTVSDLLSPVNKDVMDATKLTFAYPDARRNAESMFVDPATKDIYVISKDASTNRVYRAAYPQSTSGTNTMQLVATFSTGATLLTAADISPDGNEILIRSYGTNSAKIFVRPTGGTIAAAFSTTPITIPLASEPQGEAIGFDPNGRGYFTTSEGGGQPVYYFTRTASPAGAMYWDNDGVAPGSYIATGAGIGGTGAWNASAKKWYSGGAEVPWVNGNDAVFWGTAGTVTLAAGQSVNSLAFKTNGYSLTGSTLTLAGSSIAVDASVGATISSVLAGSAGLVKNGTGSLVLSSANTYAGNTTVALGALVLTNTTGSATGAGPVVVTSGAILTGTGTAQGNVTNSGVVRPGILAGTLHIGSYTQEASGRLEIELPGELAYDNLQVGGSASLAGTLAVSLTLGFLPQAGDVFEILTAAEFGGSMFSTNDLPAIASGLTWNVNYGASAVTLSVDLAGDFDRNGAVDAADYVWWRKNDGSLASYDTWRANFGRVPAAAASAVGAVAVPEPMTWLLLVFGAATVVMHPLRLR